MANSKSSSQKKSKSQPKKAPSTKRKESAAPPPEPSQSHSREIAAVVFALTAVLLAIGAFNSDGVVIVFFGGLFKGLIGWGYWALVPVFLASACILGFHRERPAALRLTAMLLLPILFGAMAHLLYADELSVSDLKLATGQLFTSGQALASGGVIGGLLGIALETAFSVYGAFFLLLVLFALALMIGLKLDVNGLGEKLRIRAAEREVPADDVPPEETPQRPAPKKQPVADKPVARRERASYSVDIPLGEEEEALFLPERPAKNEPPAEAPQPAPLPRRTKVRKKNLPAPPVNPTEHIEPLSEQEAAKIAGIPLDEGFVEIPVPEKKAKSGVTLAGEISDPPRGKKLSREEVAAEAQAVAEAVSSSEEKPAYEFPPKELLHSGSAATADYKDEVRLNRERLETALHSFGISAGIVGVIRGPTVTRYDIELEQGVKLSRVTNLAGDLALALGVVNVRIAPIPDKISTVGIEVPNKIVSTVYLREILDSPRFAAAKSKLSFALGKDIAGEGVIGNIAKLPHLLIAGTTGSGKSVCMNSLILSLLYKARPDEVRLIMIDPKMVELGIYNGIPHLYVPVVTDPKKAAGALQWSVVEMLKRYRLFSEAGVRDLESYNKLVLAKGETGLPQVVIVIDELADLMMIASKEVEESICRVAQMGRAAGMHLVIATQRPSADVITGLMKANIPSRIAFAVSSAMESRIILDQAGAEKLVGMGDMLYSPLGIGKPVRVQGTFVSDEERESVVQFIKESSEAAPANADIEQFMNKAVEEKAASDAKGAADEGPAGDYDEMLPQAVEAVLEAKACSVSMLQRRVKLGYSRAARIVDQMEELGVVGPYQGAKPRDVVIDRDGWHELAQQLGFVVGDDLSLAASMNEENEE